MLCASYSRPRQLGVVCGPLIKLLINNLHVRQSVLKLGQNAPTQETNLCGRNVWAEQQ